MSSDSPVLMSAFIDMVDVPGLTCAVHTSHSLEERLLMVVYTCLFLSCTITHCCGITNCILTHLTTETLLLPGNHLGLWMTPSSS